MFFSSKRFWSVTLLAFLLSACGSSAFQPPLAAPPQVASHTKSGDILASLPPAKRKVVVSVYEFQDQTGQMKPQDAFADYSRAVTQGGLSILNKALLDVSRRGWFTVIERGGLKNLLQERQIIKVTRGEYGTPEERRQNVAPMLYAGIILEGGIVSYESNVITGGAGAKYLGIGGDTQYRRDIVTVYLRAVSSQSGEILLSVNTSKTIYSTAVSASVFKFVSFDKLLELETGFTANEPPQFAVRQAIEMGVYALIMEGAMNGLWEFADVRAGKAAIRDYLLRRDGEETTSATEESPAKTPREAAAIANAPVRNSLREAVTPNPAKAQVSIEQARSPEISTDAPTSNMDIPLPEATGGSMRKTTRKCYYHPAECGGE